MKPATLLSLAILLSPLFAFAADGVRIERDIEYLAPDRAEKADLYLPSDVAEGQRRPAVLIIHGGGWSGGDKFAAREQNIGNTLALHGYVGMSINYVLAQQKEKNVVWPQNLYDCKTAVRWLRKNASRYQIDPDHIGAIGGSAGGHLSAMVAVTGPDAGLDPKSPYGEFSCRVQCAVDLYGPADFPSWKGKDIGAWRKKQAEDPELYRVTSPVTWVNKGDPPILILHGTGDKMVPVEQSELFAAALEKAGVEHTLVVVPDAPHSFDLQPKQRDLRPLVLGFFDKHLKK
jgi:acetyl esterase/lipase